MKRYFYMAFIAITILSCNQSSKEIQDIASFEPPAGIGNEENKPEEKNQLPVADTSGFTPVTLNQTSSSKSDNADWDKKIIKTADLQLQLDDFKKFNTSIHNSLKQYGAYIAAEKQQESDYRIENSVTIKVPVEQFDNLVNSFTGDGIKMMQKNVSSDDVTGEVVDTKARLLAKLAVREKYLQLLKQAKNMNEILQVQNEINEIQENIEAANGRINYLQHASAFSTINLSYYQYINGSTSNDENPDFFTKMIKAFSNGTSVISNLLLFCISIWPLLLIGLLSIVYLKRMKLKKVRKA